MKAIIIKNENLREVLATFPRDLIFQINNPDAPQWARVVTIPSDNVRACGGVIAGYMAKYGITEFNYFDPELKPYIDMARQVILINHNHGLRYSVLFDNFFANLSTIVKSPGVQKDQFKGMPALIVSSGPSLNKNIHLFPEAKGKCLTITSGSAIGAVQHRGWEPDIACLVDPFSLADVDFKPGDYRLVATYTARMQNVQAAGHSFFKASTAFDAPLTLPPTEKVQVDISVATTAYNLAVLWGCEPIIFIGQDCGISKGEKYAVGISDTTSVAFKDEQDPIYAMMAEYFRFVFPQHTGTIYNCTEGGRHLGEGAKHVPLADVLATFPDRGVVEWDGGKVWDVSFECRQQAKEIMNSYRLAKLFDDKANSGEKIERFLRQQVGTAAWNWLGKMMMPIMYECEGDYRKWYIAYLTWQEWCLKLARKLEEV